MIWIDIYPSPNGPYPIRRKHPVIADDCHVGPQRRRDQHAIHRVPVMRRQRVGGLGITPQQRRIFGPRPDAERTPAYELPIF